MNFEWIHPQSLTEAEIEALTKGCAAILWRKTDPVALVERALEGTVGFYRVSGEAEGLVVCSQDGESLFIELLVGRDFLRPRHFKAIHEFILEAAAARGFATVSGFVTRRGLAKLYDSMTEGKPLATLYVERLNGRAKD